MLTSFGLSHTSIIPVLFGIQYLHTLIYFKKANNFQFHGKLSIPLPFSLFTLINSVSLDANKFVSIEVKSWRWQQDYNIAILQKTKHIHFHLQIEI